MKPHHREMLKQLILQVIVSGAVATVIGGAFRVEGSA